MQRIAMARQRADREPGVADHLAEIGRAPFVLQIGIDIDVIAARPGAGTQLDRFHLVERSHLRQHVFYAELREHGSKQPKFHFFLAASRPMVYAYRTSVQTPPSA